MAESKTKGLEELKWIEETSPVLPPPIDDYPAQNDLSFKERLITKTSQNLFVPLGLLATATCLALGLVNLSRGDSRKQQFFMRGRVFFQGCTLVAMTTGVWLTERKRKQRQASGNSR